MKKEGLCVCAIRPQAALSGIEGALSQRCRFILKERAATCAVLSCCGLNLD
jgi:hypothetical protein